MPARTNGSATTALATKPKRFELPALDFKFGSLTDGTNIPPPLPSPIEEEPSELKLKENKPSATSSSKTNGALPGADDATSNSLSSPTRPLGRAGLKRPADDIPASPTLSSRPGSIRRLFSRNLLNTAYANAEGNEGHLPTSNSTATVPGSIIRPESRSDGSILDERKARRSSGWFRRLRGGGTGDSLASSSASINGGAPSSPLSKRSSVLFADAKKPRPQPQSQPQPSAKPAGPPPPMIPELGELEAKVDLDEGSLGGDLFKNIK
ncbi:hypothetical protein SPBR_05256 [Sporothrix brasiliensis 5110]|uniref:Uncharacterized protein n=1 Tax=Sporothrix brasiliensis 5110 TaxID=1398154 RepID=A0A0C2IDK8_9PEZI|nr:uncharacterized protein SPBR_05256 [Sporothrix brasiliensis 5110]KIH87356.1 hypothetical protein SPBR_05256 [Sporothrix brasiliensis 5110]